MTPTRGMDTLHNSKTTTEEFEMSEAPIPNNERNSSNKKTNKNLSPEEIPYPEKIKIIHN